jgi:glycosyltransferase involved in cell wall biosynthesis
MRRSVHVYPSPFTHESRMLREIRATIRAGLVDEAHVLGTAKPGLPALETPERGVVVHRIPLPAQGWLPRSVTVPVWARAAGNHMASLDPCMIHAHALSVLRAAVAIGQRRAVPVVYDAHELETERAGCSRMLRVLLRAEEALLMPSVSTTIVVGEEIADHYRRRYPNSSVWTVRNVPEGPRPTRASASGTGVRFGYIGNLVEGRSLRECIQAVRSSGRPHTLDLFGSGRLEGELRTMAGDDQRIRFHGFVPPAQVAEAASRIDVGLCLIQDICESYRLSAPNKLFQYIHAGTAVVGSDLPEIRRVICGSGVGWCIKPGGLGELLGRITTDEVSGLRANLDAAADRYSWEREERALIGCLSKFAGATTAGGGQP